MIVTLNRDNIVFSKLILKRYIIQKKQECKSFTLGLKFRYQKKLKLQAAEKFFKFISGYAELTDFSQSDVSYLQDGKLGDIINNIIKELFIGNDSKKLTLLDVFSHKIFEQLNKQLISYHEISFKKTFGISTKFLNEDFNYSFMTYSDCSRFFLKKQDIKISI